MVNNHGKSNTINYYYFAIRSCEPAKHTNTWIILKNMLKEKKLDAKEYILHNSVYTKF